MSSKEQVKGDLITLKQVMDEMKVLKAKLHDLNEEKKRIEEAIMVYLDETDELGVKYQNIIVLAKEKTGNVRLKKKEKNQKLILALEELGITDPVRAAKIIEDCQKGPEQVTKSIQIKKSN